MHLNYHFLQFLCPAIENKFSGHVISEIYFQKSGEFILHTKQGGTIRLHIVPPFIYFSFPENFQPAKKNKQNVFQDLVNDNIVSCWVLNFERSFFLEFASGFRLLFKLHGNRSNLLLYPPGANLPDQILRKELKEDRSLSWGTLEKKIELSLEMFQKLNGNASQFLPTLGLIPRAWLKQRAYPEQSLVEKWNLMEELIDLLDAPLYSIVEDEGIPKLTLLPAENPIITHSNPLEACDELYYLSVIKGSFEREKEALLKALQSQVKKTSNYIQKTGKKLTELKESPPPSQLADIVMANLHLFDGINKEVMLWDFYENKEIKITLKPNQKPQDFASQLYRKNKNRKIEWEQLSKTILAKEIQLTDLNNTLEALENINSHRELNKYKKSHDTPSEINKTAISLPYRVFEKDGYKIWVGKSAKDNDEMLRNHSKKNDLWLHARSVSGSHVLIKTTNLPEPPKSVLETAAQLAAYYSKNKSESLAPVIYTPCKFVRKVKGSPAGAVVVEKEKVIMVPPASPEMMFGKKL